MGKADAVVVDSGGEPDQCSEYPAPRRMRIGKANLHPAPPGNWIGARTTKVGGRDVQSSAVLVLLGINLAIGL